VGESGHIFVARGDVLTLASDANVIPTDADLRVEEHWHAHLRTLEGVVLKGEQLGLIDENLRAEPGVVGPLLQRPSSGPVGQRHARQTFLVPTGVRHRESEIGPEDPRWQQALDDLDRALRGFARRFRETRGELPPPLRGCPLVSVPLLGSDSGGFKRHFRPYAADLLRILRGAATLGGFDVALVIHGQETRATALEALCRLERRDLDGLMPTLDDLAERWQLGDEAPKESAAAPDGDIATSLARLVEKARSGELVPFFGAGVSRSAGAMSWEELVDALVERAGLAGRVSTRLDLLSRAQIVENSLGSEALQAAITELLRETQVSLQHLLLAGLAARDAITTNFDDVYERAVEESGRGTVAVVPRPGSSLRLLKLHGSLPRAGGTPPQETPVPSESEESSSGDALRPILTRDQFLEHERQAGPLRGALQMLLLTGHVLFVGYSLNDPDLHAAIHEVRHIRELANLPAHEPLATAVQVEVSQELSYLWAPTVNVLWPTAAELANGDTATANMKPRELEILLDVLADEANLSDLPVLAFEPHELTEEERDLREALDTLVAVSTSRQLPAAIAQLLHAYGLGGVP
jgi:hypothetical protein